MQPNNKQAQQEIEDVRHIIAAKPPAPNPYDWGVMSPIKLYTTLSRCLVGLFSMCFDAVHVLYDQKNYDAVHVFANHTEKFAQLTDHGEEPLFGFILDRILTSSTGTNFLFAHHLHNCIKFESEFSSKALANRGVGCIARSNTL